MRESTKNRFRAATVIAALVLLAGCSSKIRLIATPRVSLGEAGQAAFAAIPEADRRPEMSVIYAADRDIVRRTPMGVKYGSGRSGQLNLGVAVVDFDGEADWDSIVAASTRVRWSYKGTFRPALSIIGVTAFGRLAIPLENMRVLNGRYQLTEGSFEEIKSTRKKLFEMLHERLGNATRRDVYLYVHGVSTTFDESVIRLAMMWHFAGRPGVPIAYNWPAGGGGLRGYAYDRESGEFTIFHLKVLLRALAECPDVERVHIIAHSRGCDIVRAALRELNIEIRAKNLRTQEQLKLENLVLTAPDLDPDVFEQRFAIEDLHLAARRTTVYLSRSDWALWLSKHLFGGDRLGNLTVKNFTPDAREKMSQLKSFFIVNCNVTGFGNSHDYAFAHPAVVSDLILLLRDNQNPGAENGRPLEMPIEGIWEVNNDYLKPRDPPP